MATTLGTDARTNVIYATERLKEKFPQAVSFDDLIAYVLPSEKRQDTDTVQLIRRFLRVNPKVSYDEVNKTYKFRPLHNIASANDLLAYFQKQDTESGLLVRELKDGWADAETTINALEADNKLLVTRNKKDGNPRIVWPNDSSMVAPLDSEFKDIWSQTNIPNVDDVIKDLVKMGHHPTGEVAKVELGPRVEKKKKKARRGVKVTNVHMQGLFRDYSEKRPTGEK